MPRNSLGDMDFPEGVRPSGDLSMAGSTADIALPYSSRGFPNVEIEGIGYVGDLLTLSEDIIQPTESNQSDARLGDIMPDPRDSLSLEEFLDAGFYIKMPYRKKNTIKVTIKSITRGFPKFPDFED